MHSEPPISIGPNTDDRELLRLYTQGSSATAFAEIVRRHLNPVYSTALRRVNGDHALAEDVTQTVFVDFARKAGGIGGDIPLGGWLHRHTGFVASKMIDRERRRRAREQEAVIMNDVMAMESPQATDPVWTEAAPLLDEAIDALPASDRDALVLRFFEEKDWLSKSLNIASTPRSAINHRRLSPSSPSSRSARILTTAVLSCQNIDSLIAMFSHP